MNIDPNTITPLNTKSVEVSHSVSGLAGGDKFSKRFSFSHRLDAR
jgi:hypothetical protein